MSKEKFNLLMRMVKMSMEQNSTANHSKRKILLAVKRYSNGKLTFTECCECICDILVNLPLNQINYDIELKIFKQNGYNEYMVDEIVVSHKRKRRLRNTTTLTPPASASAETAIRSKTTCSIKRTCLICMQKITWKCIVDMPTLYNHKIVFALNDF